MEWRHTHLEGGVGEGPSVGLYFPCEGQRKCQWKERWKWALKTREFLRVEKVRDGLQWISHQIYGHFSVQFSSVAQSCPTLWDPTNLSTPGLRPLPTPGVYSNSCPSSWWCHPAISSSVIPFSSCPQSLPASESFPMSQICASGGQSTGVSASTSVFPMNTQDWTPLGWTGWIPCSPRDSQESSPTPQFKSINSSALSFLYCPALTSIWPQEKP